MILVDSHCHLDSLDYSCTDLPSVLEAAQKRDVKYYLSVATTLSGYQRLKPNIVLHDNVMLSCGVHPLNLMEEPFDFATFETLASEPEVVALGETGLDFHHRKDDVLLQLERFSQHIWLGKKLAKPIIVHTRAAKKETLSILKREQVGAGVLHCFTEDIDMARQLLDLGFYISVSGIITFNSADKLREVVRYIPLSRLLVETDSPYLAPVPYRGKANQPAYVREVAECLAALKKVSIEQLASQTTENFCRLFKQILI